MKGERITLIVEQLCPNHFVSLLNTGQLLKDVGCFGLNGPLRQYCSLYRAVAQREGKINEK